MDPLTHFLTGAALSRAGFNRKSGLATLTMGLAAELPDIDVLVSLRGPVTGFAHHRGITHTFLGAPLVAAGALAMVACVHWWMKRRGKPVKSPPRWGLLYLFALIAALSHILLDFTNNYSVRPFEPFNNRWFAWDIMFIIEPLMLVALVLALVVPLFFGLISGEVGAKRPRHQGQGSAITALVFIVLLWWGRDYNHRRAIALLNQQTYHDLEPVRVSAGPYFFNPFKWLGIVETPTSFEVMDVDTWQSEVDPQRNGVTLYKPEETPTTLAAKKSPLGRVYLDWARYPYVEVEILEPPGSGAIVHMRDLRFAYPGYAKPPLSIAIGLDGKLNVTFERVGSRQQD